MTRIELSDPVVFADRACRGVDQELFFATGRQTKRIEQAKALCGRCPRLEHCAQWALPLAASAQLAECVVAAVYLPANHSNKRSTAARAAAVDELAGIAASAPAEGAA
ncbi:WhiB family transcriptional regulator [Nocardia sp. NPDC023852]|uniref:WhiB family transcriptional regulator n=1 Tax=Nocardia sp. NPDC023852 TaxID=3154697 RepID=UPI0033DCC490